MGILLFFNVGSDLAESDRFIPGTAISVCIAKCGLGLSLAVDATQRVRYGLDCGSQMSALV
jgi:hypothetical protein